MNLGVLLLYCKEGRTTSFTRDWAELAVRQVAYYMFDQSGGRETITFDVFDWVELNLTEAEWMALKFGAYNTVRPFVEQALGVSLAPYTHILIGIDTPSSSGGTTPGAFTLLAASNFTPSLIAHELGHRLGAGDAFRETPSGPAIYENHFCVMGALGFPYTFADDALADPNALMLNQSGPGMSAPTLMATGWLNEAQHGFGVDITGSAVFSSSGTIEMLSALAGAPGLIWVRPPLVIRYQDLLVEYRIRAPAGWDRGLPDPGAGAVGWLVVHRSPSGTPSAVYVDSVAARPGAVLILGKDSPLDIFNPGPLKISVLSVDAEAGTVRLHFSRRAGRELPSGILFGGIEVGAGGLVWTPGRGFTPVPPHSPLLNVLDQVARVHGLEQMLAIASAEEAPAIAEEASFALSSLQQSVASLRVEPSTSPLAYALESISELCSASERLSSSTGDGEMTQEFVEASRQHLAEVQNILADAVEAASRQ